ncbi:YcgN family cysteine cluster protein [Paracoccus sp. PS-1]|uniref:YcgN family cysteine cluster protein n=1 Tax=unclassified Paracoccus (in: a-proteobacteria) TaxID=2688777 RepID=UPI00048C9349|nr:MULTISPECIES: YcgN family cysteine cluster protein [unclassified Paracoccus (in: a-proteobacteria)]MDQ7262353.1 YcgN family cysteine cluster protein [Paracoccus sp. PS1]RQP05209.1 MAG: YcgN family cysteine cluster protein [Paracoccus sp. BP8]UFM63567.1 YcgN family cysteine cluster protein [Paracoccus sp. MA]
MRPRFWELPLASLDQQEWEALCDGCGKCCLNKIEYEDTGELAFTRVACRLLDGQSCQCMSYANRHDFVPDCVVLTPKKLKDIAWWLPSTCAYRLRAEGKPLYDWHYLISGDRESVHRAGASVRGWTVSELTVTEDDWDEYIIEDLA